MRVALLAHFPLHVIPGYEEPPPAHFATWLPQLSARYAEAAGWDIHWITVARRAVPAQPIRWRGQTFHFLRNPARLRMLRGYRKDVRLIRERLGVIQPELVHAWGTEDCYGLAGAMAGGRWLLSMQGLLGEYIRRSPMHPFVHLQALYEKFILRRAREISVESLWGEQILRRVAPHARTHLVEYGVQEPFYRQRWEPDPEKPHAIFVGTVDRRKGIAGAVQAFARPELQGMELHVIGGADSRFGQRLRAVATPNVLWRGQLDAEATAAALGRAWCLVLPTLADTSPNVVKEARVIGLPVVTSPHGGQSDYIRDGENGFLCEPDDVAGLARAVAKLLGDLPFTRAMGGRDWEEQRAFFQPERTAQRFLALYRALGEHEVQR